MKFRRISPDRPVVLYAGHFYRLFIDYAFEWDGSPPEPVVLETDLRGYGNDASITTAYLDSDTWRVTVEGRWATLREADVLLQIELGEALADGTTVVEDYLPIRVRDARFWAGNPIRIPVDEALDEVDLWVETRHFSAEFRLVGRLKIQPSIRDEFGNYVELHEILSSELGKDLWRDFAGYRDAEDWYKMQYGIRRFHLGYAGSVLMGSTAGLGYNTYTVLAGTRDPRAWFESENRFGLPHNWLSWGAGLPAQNMGRNPVTVPVPLLSVRDSQYEISENASVTGSELMYRAGEVVVDTAHHETGIYVLMRSPEGLRVLYTEQVSIRFREIVVIPGVVAQGWVLTSVAEQVLPQIFVFYSRAGELWQTNFAASLTYDNEVKYSVKLSNGQQGQNWEFCAGAELVDGNALVYVRRVGSQDHAFLNLAPGTNTGLIDGPLLPNTGVKLLSAAYDVENDQAFVIFENGILYRSDAGAYASLSSVYTGSDSVRAAMLWVAADRLLFVMMGTTQSFYDIWNTTSGSTESIIQVSIPYSGDRTVALCRALDTVYVSTFSDNQEAKVFPLFDDTNGLGIGTEFNLSIAPYTIRAALFRIWTGPIREEATLYLLNQTDDYWHVLETTEFSRLPQEPGGMVLKYTLTPEPGQEILLSFTNLVENVAMRYVTRNKVYAQERYLLFRNSAAGYEVVFLPSDLEEDMSAKKVGSTRYVDAASLPEMGAELMGYVEETDRVVMVRSTNLSREQYRYLLREVLLTKEAYLMEGNDYTPVLVRVKDADPVSDAPTIYRLKLILTKAWKLK